MKNTGKLLKIVTSMVLVCGLMISSLALAVDVPFTADGTKYVVSLSDEWFYYSADLGDESPLCIAVSRETLDDYAQTLNTQVIGVNASGDEIYISVRDRSDGVGFSPSEEVIQSYYDGVALGRGSYTQETRNGKKITRFANNPRPNGGEGEYLSTFLGSREVIANLACAAKKTNEDLEMLYKVILSVKEAK